MFQEKQYSRLRTREVKIGDLLLGNGHPIRLQTMTTKDTMDTLGTVEETIRCIEAGAELVRITAPSKKEAENLLHIKNELRRRGYSTPLVADIHFTPNAAEVAARIVEKVRINPGNYIDKKRFELIEYTDADYAEEIGRIRQKFTPLIQICKEYGTALRIGTNHGSLSDRIMSRYGDTPVGMVESAMEFLRIAREEQYHNIVLSMKSSNPQVMVQAYRLLVQTMLEEFGEAYPLHLGVTEAGDGEDGRIKSAIGIGTLLEDGIGDTVRVSLTEDPELEIPVCRDLVRRYSTTAPLTSEKEKFSELLTGYVRRRSFPVNNIGATQVPVVIADLSKAETIRPETLERVGYMYDASTDKWNIGDMAADYVYVGDKPVHFSLPGTLKVIADYHPGKELPGDSSFCPVFSVEAFGQACENQQLSGAIHFVRLEAADSNNYTRLLEICRNYPAIASTVVIWLSHTGAQAMATLRSCFGQLQKDDVCNPVILHTGSRWNTVDEHLIHYAIEAGGLLLDGFGDGVSFGMAQACYNSLSEVNAAGRNYSSNNTVEQFINSTAFSILQATRTRISKTEYISCPSCGRTLFDLQETTARIRAVTNHLKGVKIAIMGCIVNGPGEMADADFGYVGSGVDKITLYKGKEIVKKGVPAAVAVDELINLLKENGAWVEPVAVSAL